METTELLSDYELERGKPMPGRNHGLIQSRLSFLLLRDYENEYDFLAESSLELTTGKATPDLAVYPKLPRDWFNDEVRMTTPPLSVFEILSPTQGLQDLTDKAATYFGAGVQSYWVIIPTFKTVHLILPNQPINTVTAGIITDPATRIVVQTTEIFK
ncbi:MAG: Uma2 family endonuclease [Ferruginibacter sp.]|nr:Uma2 family endonuclease [Cytophagales bacterium]